MGETAAGTSVVGVSEAKALGDFFGNLGLPYVTRGALTIGSHSSVRRWRRSQVPLTTDAQLLAFWIEEFRSNIAASGCGGDLVSG
jgi:hypothetical protein